MKNLLFVCLFVCSLTTVLVAQKKVPRSTSGKGQSAGEITNSRSPFRYVIVAGVSETEKYANRGPHYYVMDVLMEDQAFKEENLKLLFRLLSDRFTDRPGLFINVFTSLDALRTPEEYDETPLAGPISEYHKYKFAFFSRHPGGESFQYGIPNVLKPTRVVMRSGSSPK